MTQHVVRYTVKPDQTLPNEELVRAVFAELHRVQPAGLRYAAFQLDDDVSFIHLVWNDATNPLPPLPALRAFHAGMRERCDEAPIRSELSEIGSYRLFGDV